MKTDSNYYVYAYFDPRNYEMFYVGKGKDSRKNAHHPDKAGTAKERRIAEIKKAGQKPNIKVVAVNLTEKEAYLVETALMWRPRESLTNLTRGNYVENFRPPDTLHQQLPGFDTDHGVFRLNVGDEFGPHRQWEDAYKYNFVAAGYGRKYSKQLYRLSVGDIVAAYLVAKDYKKRGLVGKSGFVGIGRVMDTAVPAAEFRFNGRLLSQCVLKGPKLLHDPDDAEKCEHLVRVKWIKKVSREEARFRSGAKLFVGRGIVVDLSNQLKTQEFLEQQFKLKFDKLLATD